MNGLQARLLGQFKEYKKEENKLLLKLSDESERNRKTDESVIEDDEMD